MTKRIICTPTIEEMDEYIQILQNVETLKTIIEIKKTLRKKEKEEIECDIRLKEMELSEWWERITEKYNFPYYNSGMYIDLMRKFIYVFEKNTDTN